MGKQFAFGRFRIEISRRGFGFARAGVTLDDGELTVESMGPLGGVFVSSRVPSRKTRTAAVSLNDGRLSFYLWNDNDVWVCNGSVPFWHPHRRRLSFNLRDALLGKPRTSAKRGTPVRYVVMQPEGAYRVDVTRVVWTVCRPRAPLSRYTQFEVVCVDPIPVPGKGEDPQGLLDDAIERLYAPAAAQNERTAIDYLLAEVANQRRKYGGPDWRPEKSPEPTPAPDATVNN